MSAPLRVDTDDRGVATLTLNRPRVRNAFDAALVTELHQAAEHVGTDQAVRVVVVTGAGPVFSAGADVQWMRAMKDASHADNVADARRLDGMLRAWYDLPKPLIGRINGHALGGGAGLVAVCDIAVASASASFGFTEVALGLAPAVISPYVLRTVTPGFARSVFVTGERFDAARALKAGLVHQVTEPDQLDTAVAATVDRCLAGGPRAVAAAKLLTELARAPLDEATAATPAIIAELRASDEGQEGMAAFLARRPPAWRPG